MNIVFNDKDGDKLYRLKKLNLGWELEKWRGDRKATSGRYVGRDVPAGWCSMGKYPHNIKHAVMIISEESFNSLVGDVKLKTALQYVLDYVRNLETYAEEIEDDNTP